MSSSSERSAELPEPVAELKDRFLKGLIPEKYFENSLVKFPTQTSRSFLVNTRQSAERPFLAAGGTLASLYKSIVRATQKIEYGKYSPRQWESHYIFPDQSAQEKSHELYMARSHDNIEFERFRDRIVNQSAGYSRQWLSQIADQAATLSLNEQPRISFLTGKLRSGKI